ncbi:MAG: LysM peptidoglycan-binding domain-containing protein [Saprospiraceae bacterium]|nr:LysM peptidoglycan-binding domain-containing protein [Saprospiraceae bacterium]
MEEQYNEELKGRISKDGEYMMLKKQYETETSSLRSKMSKRVLGLLCLPFLMLVCGRKEPQKIIVNRCVVDSLTYVKMTNEIASLKEEVEVLKASLAPKSVTHIVQEGETLEDISMKYFNNRKRAKKIGIDNGIETKHNRRSIKPGSSLIIYLDK